MVLNRLLGAPFCQQVCLLDVVALHTAFQVTTRSLRACALLSRAGGIEKLYKLRLSAEDIMQSIVVPVGSA